MNKKKYRLYIDEVGNTGLGRSLKSKGNQFLSLTGVVFELSYMNDIVNPALENFKVKHLASHVDDPVNLHRREIVNKEHAFSVLKNPEAEILFNRELLNLLEQWDYLVITVTMDKKAFYDKYKERREEPYYYCMMVMVERYIRFLTQINHSGDVMAEARNKKADKALKESFGQLYNNGTYYVGKEIFQARLTSRNLKLKTKTSNITGLQVADIIAHPSYKSMIDEKEGLVSETFGNDIIKVVKPKYYRGGKGNTSGCGRKWLP